jgi:hypothetical protein
MYDPFTVQQAYIINYTLAFLPQMVVEPEALRSGWRPISAFVKRGKTGDLMMPEVGRLLRLSSYSSVMWPRDKWRFAEWPRPWVVDVEQWRLTWLPEVELPSEANPSTQLFIHVYPLGVVSIGLATAVGFGDGIEIEPLIVLLKQMTPAKEGGAKSPWLRISAPESFAGREVNLDDLADLVLGRVRETLFESPEIAQVIRRSTQPEEAHLQGNNGGIVELVRVVPQRFDKDKHAAGFRGIVTMRPSWQDINPDHLVKYQKAKAWTGRMSAWHYAGGLNTVLWNAPGMGRRRMRRGYPWRVAAISELARMEKVLYEYGRTFVAKELHVPLDKWRPLWRGLGGLPRVLRTNDMHLAYESHAQALDMAAAREALRSALANRGDVEAMEQEHLVRLRQILVERFSEPELRTLCFDLGIEYDDLGGRGRSDNARELIACLHRRRRISKLLETVRVLRSDIDWEGFDE